MRQWHKWRLSGQVASIITFGLVALLLIIACWPNYHLTAAVEQALLTTVTITGLLLTLYSAVAMWLVWRWTLEYSTDNYSNTDDFPLSYARRVFMVPVFQALLLWPVSSIVPRMLQLSTCLYLFLMLCFLSPFFHQNAKRAIWSV